MDALSRNARLNFAVAISTYTINLNEQLKAGIEQDEIYQNYKLKLKKIQQKA